MKTITRLFLVGLIALGMTACSNEDEIQLEGQPDATVSIKVVPSSNGPTVRSIGDLSGDGILAEGLLAESAIKTLEVFVFNGDTPDGYGIASGTGITEVTGIATHSGAKTIVVVANANPVIGPVANKTILLAKTRDLPILIANGLPMTGESESVTLAEGLNKYGYTGTTGSGTTYLEATPLPLTRVNARVAIVAAALGELPAGQAALFDALTDVQVAMFNVPKTTKLFGSPLETSGGFLFGENWPTSTTAPSYTYVAGNLNASFKESPGSLPIAIANAPYFYVNENMSATQSEQMMIVLRAKPTKDGAAVTAEGVYTDTDGYTYYPIWVNAAKTDYSYATGHTADSKILRNIQYNISLTIKGLGNPNIDPPVKSMLDVMVEVAPWLVVDQTVVWN